MLPEIQQLYDKLYDKDVFIIGGGFSFSQVDKRLFEGRLIISLNSALKSFPDATALYWCDKTWADNNYKILEKHPCQLRFTQRRLNKSDVRKHKSVYNSVVLKNTGDFGYDPDIDCIRGNNAGTQILNFIINMNPSRILLLGFDMKQIGIKTHWHEEYTTLVKNQIYDTIFIPSMNSFADELVEEQRNKIINCSLDSALTCFKKDSIENYIT